MSDNAAMPETTAMLETKAIAEITIHDEASFRHVGLYDALKQAMLDRNMCFHLLGEAAGGQDAARLLNLAFWDPSAHAEVLSEAEIEADQLMHNAWHVLAREACGEHSGTADALLLGESIASAFDVYLIGRTIGQQPDSSFLQSQVAAMSESAAASGASESEFEDMLGQMAREPERCFEALRQLLFDVSTTLVAASDLQSAAAALAASRDHAMYPLLHHYELPTWVLYARHYASHCEPTPSVRAIDEAMRGSDDSIAWLEARWVAGRG
jgi:hypothetical protein